MHWRVVENGVEFGWLFVLIALILIVIGIFQLITLLSGRGRREVHGESPVHILKRRYAKGEIGKEEFEKMKKDIEGKICDPE